MVRKSQDHFVRQKNVSTFATKSSAGNIGTAIILNSFPAFETKQKDILYRTEFYTELEKEWDNIGLDTTLVMSSTPTVEDYKDLNGYNLILISTHGSTYSWNEGLFGGEYHEVPAICLFGIYVPPSFS